MAWGLERGLTVGRLSREGYLQGYLAHKKTPPPMTLQWTYAQNPTGVLGGWAFSYERGTLVDVGWFQVGGTGAAIKAAKLLAIKPLLSFQGYHAHKTPPPRRTLQSPYA